MSTVKTPAQQVYSLRNKLNAQHTRRGETIALTYVVQSAIDLEMLQRQRVESRIAGLAGDESPDKYEHLQTRLAELTRAITKRQDKLEKLYAKQALIEGGIASLDAQLQHQECLAGMPPSQLRMARKMATALAEPTPQPSQTPNCDLSHFTDMQHLADFDRLLAQPWTK